VGADPEAAKVRRFEEQVLVHLGDLYRVALRLSRSAPDAEDLVQETCLRAFQAFEQLRDPGAAKAWVFTILRSVFLRQAERRAAQPPRVSFEDLDGFAVAEDALRAAHGEGSPLRATLLQEIRGVMLKLPLPYREAIVLAHIGGFSYREMAQILEVPVGTVMSRLFRGRRMLRASLQEVVAPQPRVEPAS
jgi:RNA polymerase sigma-70 factor (ECF subfamily)